MIKKALVLGAAASMLVLAPATPANAASGCGEGSRKIDVSDVVEYVAEPLNGSRGRTVIKLRHSPSQNCFWGLIDGPGEIWLEKISYYDPSGQIDPKVYRRANKENDVNHTAATVTTEHRVRACGRTYNGAETDSRGFGANVGADGRSASGGVSGQVGGSDDYEFGSEVVCTPWASADVITPKF